MEYGSASSEVGTVSISPTVSIPWHVTLNILVMIDIILYTTTMKLWRIRPSESSSTSWVLPNVHCTYAPNKHTEYTRQWTDLIGNKRIYYVSVSIHWHKLCVLTTYSHIIGHACPSGAYTAGGLVYIQYNIDIGWSWACKKYVEWCHCVGFDSI